MFHKTDYKNQPKSIPLTNPQSSYKKLEKEMNKPPSDYNSIKSMVENGNNSLKILIIKNLKMKLSLYHIKRNN
jgi:predicted patatin/cPLA2 family phospholipase